MASTDRVVTDATASDRGDAGAVVGDDPESSNGGGASSDTSSSSGGVAEEKIVAISSSSSSSMLATSTMNQVSTQSRWVGQGRVSVEVTIVMVVAVVSCIYLLSHAVVVK
jgi:hypothetical protein